MYMGSLEEGRARISKKTLVTVALYEAKVKDDEILRVLMKMCGIDREEGMAAIQKEKFISFPCRELHQYLILEKGFNPHDADVFVHNRARVALARNVELSKLSPAKMFDAINKANKCEVIE